MAMGVELPQTIFAHGWWLTNDEKMSKSLGNVINPMDMIDKYGVDAFRYYLIAAMSLGQDANFTEKLFNTRYNAELANDLGNLVSRALTMLERFNGGFVPEVSIAEDEASATLRKLCKEAVDTTPVNIDNMKLDTALATIMNAVREANKYWTDQKPWVLAKEGIRAGLCTTVVMNWSFWAIPLESSSTFFPHQSCMPKRTNQSFSAAIASGLDIPLRRARYIACSPTFILR